MHDSRADVVRRRGRAQRAAERWFSKRRSPEPAACRETSWALRALNGWLKAECKVAR